MLGGGGDGSGGLLTTGKCLVEHKVQGERPEHDLQWTVLTVFTMIFVLEILIY